MLKKIVQSTIRPTTHNRQQLAAYHAVLRTNKLKSIRLFDRLEKNMDYLMKIEEQRTKHGLIGQVGFDLEKLIVHIICKDSNDKRKLFRMKLLDLMNQDTYVYKLTSEEKQRWEDFRNNTLKEYFDNLTLLSGCIEDLKYYGTTLEKQMIDKDEVLQIMDEILKDKPFFDDYKMAVKMLDALREIHK
ncbi:hypothetical protein ABK040_001827 [Willaertia magna]